MIAFDGTNWNYVGTFCFTPGEADYTSLAVYKGTPYVAFKDVANGGKASMMKYNGSSWVSVSTADFSDGAANYVDLFNYNGDSYVAYSDAAHGNKATVKAFK